MKRFAIFIIVIIFFGNLLLGQSGISLTDAERADAEKIRKVWLERLKNIDVPIDFYGKVIDQNGEPVLDAEIKYSIHGFSDSDYAPFCVGITTKGNVKTDANGYFSITGAKGIVLDFYRIDKRGYEYLSPKDEFDYIGNEMERCKALMDGKEYKPASIEDLKKHCEGMDINKYYQEYLDSIKPFKPDKNKPVVFTMRKKGKQEYLFVYSVAITFENGKGNLLYIDLVNLAGDNCYTDKSGYTEWAKTFHTDVIVTVEGEEENARFVFSTPDKGSGLICSKQPFYIAPESGYTPQITIRSTDPNALYREEYYIGFKGRNGAIYSQFNVDVAPNNSSIIISDFTTNPHGSRILEPLDEPLPEDEEKKLRKKILSKFGYKD